MKKIREKWLSIVLAAALLVSGVELPIGHAEAEEMTVPLQAGTYQEHQVLVKYEKTSITARKKTARTLSQVRKDKKVSSSFGAAMKAVKGARKVAATVDAQKDILAETDEGYIIEDSIDFGDYMISLISSTKDDTKTMIKKLEKNDDIGYVVPNYCEKVDSAEFSLNDPYTEYSYQLADNHTVNQQTGKMISARGKVYEDTMQDASMNVTDMWEASEDKAVSKEEIVVALIDTGVDNTHEELKDRLWENPGDIGLLGTYGYDFVHQDEEPMDDQGHGTHCAGIMLAQADNAAGIAGIAGKYADDGKIKLMSLKAFDEKGSASTAFALMGAFKYIQTAVENGVNVRVVNNSWGGSTGIMESGAFDEIFETLGQKGVLFCFSAGNDGENLDKEDGFPVSSSSDYVLTVGSLNEAGEPAVYSNYGKSQVDLFAPGSNILSSVNYQKYLPGIYDEKRLKQTTKVFGLFDGETTTPSSCLEELSTFGNPVVFNQDGKELEIGKDVYLSVSDDRYLNTKTKKSLKVEIPKAVENESYYVYFPYQTEEKSIGTNVYMSAAVGIPYDLKTDEQGTFALADIIRYENGTIKGGSGSTIDYDGLLADYGMRTLVQKGLNTYTEAAAKGVESHGLAVLYQAEFTKKATFYIDAPAVSIAGVKTSYFGKYDFKSGTSMACPAAAGAAALCLAVCPEKTAGDNAALQLKSLLMASVTETEKLSGLCVTNGYLDLKKIAQEDLKPVISSVSVDVNTNVVTITGGQFGESQGAISVSHVLDRGEEYYPPLVTWSDHTILLVDTMDENGLWKLRGNYLYITVTNALGEKGSSIFYCSKGMEQFNLLKKENTSKVIENDCGFVVSDGATAYRIDGKGGVYRIDSATGEQKNIAKAKDAFQKIIEHESFAATGMGAYELSVKYEVEFGGNPVCMEGIIYEWLRIYAADRMIYAGLKVDITKESPVWEVLSVDVLPKKNGYVKIPENFCLSYAAVAEYCGKIYAVGGTDLNKDTLGTTLVSVFDPETGIWKKADKQLPAAVSGVKLLESNGMLYAFLGDTLYDESAAYQQPDSRVFCFDGTDWKILKTRLPRVIKPVVDGPIDIVSASAAVVITGDGIIVSGDSTDGYGDTYLIDTRVQPEAGEHDIRLRPLKISMYGSLNTREWKFGAVVADKTDTGMQEAVLIFKQDSLDSITAQGAYKKIIGAETSAYYNIDIQVSGDGKGTVTGLSRVKKNGGYKETLTVTPDKKSVISAVTVDEKELQPISENVYQFTPVQDRTVKIVFALKGKAAKTTAPVKTQAPTKPAVTRKVSAAKLKVKSKTVKCGKTYKITVLKKNGQKVKFSVSETARERGVRVGASTGKVTVKKSAKKGTYKVTVKVQQSSTYKAKTLTFRVKVPKSTTKKKSKKKKSKKKSKK